MANQVQQTPIAVPQFYRLPQLKQRLGVSGSSIWAWVKEGKFPKPVKLSDNITAWEAQAVEKWAAERIAASQSGRLGVVVEPPRKAAKGQTP